MFILRLMNPKGQKIHGNMIELCGLGRFPVLFHHHPVSLTFFLFLTLPSTFPFNFFW